MSRGAARGNGGKPADIAPNDLKGFPKAVSQVIVALSRQGVKCRMPDGRHIMLYAPNGSRPFKVSATRPAKDSLRYIENQFCKPNNLEMP